MKILYQVWKNDKLVADKVTITEASMHIPAGSKLVSGNQKKKVKTQDGKEEIVEEIRALYQTPCNGPKYSIVQI